MEEWFFTKDGQQDGPITLQQIQALAKAGQLDPTTTHVWREGMVDWKTLADSGLLVGASLPAPGIAPPAMQTTVARNPYLASEQIAQGTGRPMQYPGYGRLRYFLTNLAITVVFYAVVFAVAFASLSSSGGAGGGDMGMPNPVVILLFILLVVVVSFYVIYQRVKNLGMSGWALLWTLVPFMNLWIGWRMFACPAGYENHRTLDTSAKVISGILIGLFGLMIVANILAAVLQN